MSTLPTTQGVVKVKPDVHVKHNQTDNTIEVSCGLVILMIIDRNEFLSDCGRK